ncbi:N-acetylglucosamine kinase [Streptomyces sp. DH37]|uniref:N-acetylglucosamine kinase n=1 Tax=Streptomyces sp. DH37 TaxID=3040122 RepID=UPI002442E684|nr:BadF/BadG/BcrA/BcrD ATPase family protein [Streptomyces sp. DH37]MDG9702045.1 BadF/BadG/BcrA/BcrD ATPase family protein [Streptomyces sp. DH37]
MGLTRAAALAVDAGNSKTDVALVAGDGTVLGSARGGGFQPPAVGAAAAVASLAETVARAAEEAGLGTDPGAPLAEHVSACLANADLPREERELAERIDALGWGRTTRVANDTFAILRAGLPDDGSPRHGVAVVCGAGVNCVGVAADGRVHRFPAVGRLSGDWGGGGGLVEEALWHAARAEDGRGPDTGLARALPAHFALPSMYALIEALHLGDLPGGRRHELVPVLFAVAAGGDAVARSLVERQAEEIAVMAAVTLERLDLLGTPTPVVLGGGVVAARHPLLHDRLLALLAERAPRATAHVVTAPPVLGAGLLALDRLGAGPAPYARLRAHYAARA